MLENASPNFATTTPHATVHPYEETELIGLLEKARLPLTALLFSRRPALHRSGEETVVTLRCLVGHALTYSAREIREALANPHFNDPAIVPCLCKYCAYPGQLRIKPKKATLHHRYALIRQIYPRAEHLGQFDIMETAPEHYRCGETFADGSPHPTFSISYTKLVKSGPHRHHCYACAILAGKLLDPDELRLEHVASRMQLLADLIDQRCLTLRKRRKIIPTSVQIADRRAGPLTTSGTNLVFSCHHPEHPSVVATADQYYKPSRGGYCRACLQESGLASTKELLPPPVPVGGRRRTKPAPKSEAKPESTGTVE